MGCAGGSGGADCVRRDPGWRRFRVDRLAASRCLHGPGGLFLQKDGSNLTDWLRRHLSREVGEAIKTTSLLVFLALPTALTVTRFETATVVCASVSFPILHDSISHSFHLSAITSRVSLLTDANFTFVAPGIDDFTLSFCTAVYITVDNCPVAILYYLPWYYSLRNLRLVSNIHRAIVHLVHC
ncbi:uncharacterized protein BDZ99DRAFT_543109 [Mytilinidion resinicola]|uniref:Uncharacterized protein n=1 Tax=Mytilinidion resinicola TaxID=574789 RepID=A0A6A6Z6S8_9PEZI|nr:uncharacterized protein BDZ99DRAFT_543109 [Mytilinidion resinicola]KAF2816518.1 hypothetical protein BDZ99DRAFT_543109 [Mytilinidion resinicola]